MNRSVRPRSGRERYWLETGSALGDRQLELLDSRCLVVRADLRGDAEKHQAALLVRRETCGRTLQTVLSAKMRDNEEPSWRSETARCRTIRCVCWLVLSFVYIFGADISKTARDRGSVPIRNVIWQIESSCDRRRHVTLKGQGRDPKMLNIYYQT